jgi:hypothetical protein
VIYTGTEDGELAFTSSRLFQKEHINDARYVGPSRLGGFAELARIGSKRLPCAEQMPTEKPLTIRPTINIGIPLEAQTRMEPIHQMIEPI